MKEQVLSVPAVHCDHCVMSIEDAVSILEGVEKVKVDLDNKDVFVSYDDERLQLSEIVNAIEEQGYDVGDPTPLEIVKRPQE